MLYLLLVLFAIASSLTVEQARTDFETFKARFGRSYASAEAEEFRFGVFRANMEDAEARNARRARPDAAEFGMTRFADLTREEFRQQYLNPTPVKPDFSVGSLWNSTGVAAPATTVNWFSKGACTPVYNQAQCGSCWAFSITEAIESSCYLSGNPLIQLSMQQVVSCDNSDDGCNGGDPPNAYAYVEQAGGLQTLSSYPYSSGGGDSGYCQSNSNDIARSISSWQWVTQSQDENAMKQFVSSTGPPSICVDAEPWQTYTGGILDASECGEQLDHCVQLVGYDDSASTPYWIVRNSWGASWGENGFIRLQYGQDTCGVAQEVTWPTGCQVVNN